MVQGHSEQGRQQAAVINEVRAAWGRWNAAAQIARGPRFAGRAALVAQHKEAADAHWHTANNWNRILPRQWQLNLDAVSNDYQDTLFTEDETGSPTTETLLTTERMF